MCLSAGLSSDEEQSLCSVCWDVCIDDGFHECEPISNLLSLALQSLGDLTYSDNTHGTHSMSSEISLAFKVFDNPLNPSLSFRQPNSEKTQNNC